MFSARTRAPVSAAARPVPPLRLFAMLFTVLLAACTSPEDDGFDVPPGLVYDDTLHVAKGWGVCKNASSYTAYWGLRHADANGDTLSTRWLGINVNLDSSVTPGVVPVGANTSPDDATAPAGKAAVWLNGVFSGSRALTTAKIRVTLSVDGDSAQFIGTGIVLENGRRLNFNLKNSIRCGG